MKMIKIALSLSLLCGLSYVAAPAHAASGYGDAGCGLGALVIGDKPGFVQVFAATLNGIGGQTFAISSGTSNCGGGSGVASAKAFVETNREALAKDIARGQGETITSLSILAGCQDSKVVGTALQSDFSKIFPKAQVSDKQVSGSVVDVLKAHVELACKKLS